MLIEVDEPPHPVEDALQHQPLRLPRPAARASRLTIDERAFSLGLADSTTSVRAALNLAAGLNGYLTANVRVVLDFARTSFAGGAKQSDRLPENLVAGRVQVAL